MLKRLLSIRRIWFFQRSHSEKPKGHLAFPVCSLLRMILSQNIKLRPTHFEENGREIDIFTKAPNKTLANFIFYQLSKPEDRCFMLENEKWTGFKKKDFTENRFIFAPDVMVEGLADYGRVVYQTDFFINPKSLMEILRAFYLSKRLSRRVKEFLNRWYVIWCSIRCSILLTDLNPIW